MQVCRKLNCRVFTGNCGKVTYYISGSIASKFLKCLYLDYHSWTCINTNFQYHSRSFDIRNVSNKKSDIFTPTKHFDCNQLWRIQKSNCFKKETPQELQIFTTSAFSQLRLSKVINRFMSSGDVFRPSFQVFPEPKLWKKTLIQ